MGISESELFDRFDEIADHFLFVEQDNVVGSVRLIQVENSMKLERMAIYREYRQYNFGYDAIKQIINHYKVNEEIFLKFEESGITVLKD